MARPRVRKSPFYRFNSSPEIIRLVVMMYVKYPLSLRNVEDRHCQPKCTAWLDARAKAGGMARKPKPDNSFRWFDSSPELIQLVVMLYVRYPLSLRNVEDLAFERGIDICHETVRT